MPALKKDHKHAPINWECRSVCELFINKLALIETSTYRQITIIPLASKSAASKSHLDYIHFTVDSIRLYYDFDLTHYSSMSKSEKRTYILDVIYKSTMHIANEMEWDSDKFIDAYNSCKNTDLIFRHYIAKDKKVTKMKSVRLSLLSVWDIDSHILYCHLDYNGEHTELQLCDSDPGRGEFIYALRWKSIDSSTIEINDRYRMGNSCSCQIKIESADKIYVVK